jgi:hypothetical protein
MDWTRHNKRVFTTALNTALNTALITALSAALFAALTKWDLENIREEKCGWFQREDGANVILFNLGQWPLSKNPRGFYERHMALLAAALRDCRANPKFSKWREGVQIFW